MNVSKISFKYVHQHPILTLKPFFILHIFLNPAGRVISRLYIERIYWKNVLVHSSSAVFIGDVRFLTIIHFSSNESHFINIKSKLMK